MGNIFNSDCAINVVNVVISDIHVIIYHIILYDIYNIYSLDYINSLRFYFNDFTFSWTLSSKFFATFLHSTCLLSNSRQYLALDEVYHQLKAAFSSNPTPKYSYTRCLTIRTGLAPSSDIGPYQRNFGYMKQWENHTYTLHLLTIQYRKIQRWAFPNSLAVTLGILVSFFSSAKWYA